MREFNKLLNLSRLGRNLALVYCLISLAMAIRIGEDLAYCLPAILGGFAMLGSFISHLAIEKPKYNASPVQLHKAIGKFRLHTAATARYDVAITAFWMLTFLPAFLKAFLNISLYDDPTTLFGFCLISLLVQSLLIALGLKTYREVNGKLKQAEAYLASQIDSGNLA